MTEKKVITAEFLDIEDMINDETDNTEKPEERSLDLLLQLPYSEMTEEEIERVIEYRAEIKKRDDEHDKRMSILKDAMDSEINIHKEMADKSQALLDELTRHAINRFEGASNG